MPSNDYSDVYTTHLNDASAVMQVLRTGGAALTFINNDTGTAISFSCHTMSSGRIKVRRCGSKHRPMRTGTTDARDAFDVPLGTLTIGERIEFTPGTHTPARNAAWWARDRAAITWMLVRLNEGRIPANVTVEHIGLCAYVGARGEHKCGGGFGKLASVDAMLTGVCDACRKREGITVPDVQVQAHPSGIIRYSVSPSRSGSAFDHVHAHRADGTCGRVWSGPSGFAAGGVAHALTMRDAVECKRIALGQVVPRLSR